MVHRYIVFSFSSPREAIEFMEHVQKVMKPRRIDATLRGSKVKITLHASPEDISDVVAYLKRVVREWRRARVRVRGNYRYSIPFLLRSVTLDVSIPVNAVVDILRLRGFSAEMDGLMLVTNASLDAVKRFIHLFSAKYKDALGLSATPLLKRLLAVVSAAKEVDLSDAFSLLVDKGIARYDPGQDKYILAAKYEDAIKMISSSG